MANSTEITQKMCDLAYVLNRDPWITSLIVLQVVFSLLTLWKFWLLAQAPAIRKAAGLVKIDLKVIAIGGLGYYLFSVIAALLLYVYKLVLILLDLKPCAYIWDNRTCFWTYAHFSLVSNYVFSIFHVVLLLERVYATFLPKGWKPNGIFGCVTVVFMLLGPHVFLVCIYAIILPKFPGFYGNRLYCATITNTGQQPNGDSWLSYIFVLLTLLDVTISIGDWLLLLYNRRQILRYNRQISDVAYTLNRSFQLREVKLSIRLILPFSVFHSVGYCAQNILLAVFFHVSDGLSVESSLLWKELINFTRTFGIWLLTVCLLLNERLFNKNDTMEWLTSGKRKEDATDVYFRDFQKLIS